MLLVHTVITLCELIESAFTAFFRSYCSWITEVRVNMWDALTRGSLFTRCQKAKNESMMKCNSSSLAKATDNSHNTL
jgi:hypothetical protein